MRIGVGRMGLLVIAAGITACRSTEAPRADAGSGADARLAANDSQGEMTCPVGPSPSSCPGDCPGLLARLTARVVPIDAADCLTRPAMDCTTLAGQSEQDAVAASLSLMIGECSTPFTEETVAVSFENGCATEMRISEDRPQESVTCVTGKLSAVRWACRDLACASLSFSTLP
jgi:hypothetical protein